MDSSINYRSFDHLYNRLYLCARNGIKADALLNGQNNEIPNPIEDHPFTLNPMIWIILVAVIFIGYCYFLLRNLFLTEEVFFFDLKVTKVLLMI